MGKEFDSNRGGRDAWVAWLTAIMREAIRVLMPGGHAFVWALPRTSHWTALALEDSGFEIRDEVSHLFGADSRAQAFMASLNDEQRNAFAQVIDGMRAPASVLAMFGSGFPKSSRVDRDTRFCQCVTSDNGDHTAPLSQQGVHTGIVDHHSYHDDANAHNRLSTSRVPLKAVHTDTPDPLDVKASEAQNVRYGMSTVPGSQGGYHYDHGLCDVPLHQGQEDALVSLPSQEGVPAHTHSYGREDDLHGVSSRNPSRAQHNDRLSSQDYQNLCPSENDTHDGTYQSIEELGSNPTQMDNALSESHISHKALKSSALNSPVFSYCTTCGKPIAKGLGSALKPSHETWWLVRKPLAEKSIAAQVLATGTGAINVDISRIGNGDDRASGGVSLNGSIWNNGNGKRDERPTGKRFPSNTLLSHTLLCQPRGEKRVRGTAPRGKPTNGTPYNSDNASSYAMPAYGSGTHYTDSDGMETVAAYECSEDCPVFLLDQQSGVRKSGAIKPYEHHNTSTIYGEGKGWHTKSGMITSSHEASTGGASRYYQCFPPDDMPPFTYHPKASRAERSKGCEALPERESRRHGDTGPSNNAKPNGQTALKEGNHHPTVKPLSLLKYLITMITPPNGVVLDMFAGSGSTGVACVQNGFRYILIEQEQEYVDIIHARLAHAHHAMPVQEQEYECVPECPVRILGEQSGTRKSGGGDKSSKNALGWFEQEIQSSSRQYEPSTGKADRFFKTFPPDSLFAGMDEEAL